MAVHARFPYDDRPVTVLAVHCSDFRFQRAFDGLARSEAGDDRYDRLVVPGGPWLLAGGCLLPKYAWAGERWTKFLVQAHALKRVLLIAHDDCAWYRQVYGPECDVPAQQAIDMRTASRRLRVSFPDVAINSYAARIEGAQVVVGDWTVE